MQNERLTMFVLPINLDCDLIIVEALKQHTFAKIPSIEQKSKFSA